MDLLTSILWPPCMTQSSVALGNCALMVETILANATSGPSTAVATAPGAVGGAAGVVVVAAAGSVPTTGVVALRAAGLGGGGGWVGGGGCG